MTPVQIGRDKDATLASIARAAVRHSGDDDVATACHYAREAVRRWCEPPDPLMIVLSTRQQARFRLAERHGWRGGCAHGPFIPEAERAAFDAETTRLVAAAGATPGFVLSSFGGNCPVQAEGFIDAYPWYFRARGQHWTLAVGPKDYGDASDWLISDQIWSCQQSYGDQPFEAGWMDDDEARGFIVGALLTFRASLIFLQGE